MRRRITHILLPRAPKCAACEPRGRVWRKPCRCVGGAMLRPDARRPPLPHQPLRRARSTQSVCGSSLGASDPAPLLGAPGGPPRCFAPGWLPTQPRLLDAAAPGGSRGYRLRGGAAAAAPRLRRGLSWAAAARGGSRGTAAARPGATAGSRKCGSWNSY